MSNGDPELSAEFIALSVCVKEFLESQPKTRAMRFLDGMNLTLSGRDGFGKIVPIEVRPTDDQVEIARAWWQRLEPTLRAELRRSVTR